MSRVLILTDGKAGHENQSKAFARALDCSSEIVKVGFRSRFAKALSYGLDHLGVRTTRLLSIEGDVSRRLSTTLADDPPAAVIGTGSGTFYAAKAIARRLGVKCGVVLYPRGYDIASFDCVLAPAFDRPAKAPNVIELPSNLVAADEAFYEKGVATFLARTPNGEAVVKGQVTAVAVIIGGPNKCSTMTPEWMKAQLDAIFDGNRRQSTAIGGDRQSSAAPVEFWVTTSRRTPPEVEAVVDAYPWNYRLIYSKDHFNPIPAFVKLARRLYVTAESTGMLSEACTFGTAEVIALDNLKPGPHKFRRFVEDLRAAGYIDGNRKVDLSGPFAAARRLLGL